MNKTITVNIAGIVFHIDETAYDILKPYLLSLKSRFMSTAGGEEIISDIESRIAEMFHARISSEKQVIVDADVLEVIQIMGKPEDFEDGEETQSAKSSSSVSNELPLKRRLFRDPDDKLLGGVCSGISEYLDVDPIWLRLVFAIAFFAFGSGLFLYILLWIIVPQAKTTAEKLQMRGERVNIDNIERSIKEEMENVKNRFHDFSKEAGNLRRKDFRGFTSRLVGLVTQVLTVFFEILLKFIAIMMILISLVVLCALFSIPFGYGDFNGHAFKEVIPGLFNGDLNGNVLMIGIVLFLGVPFFMLLYKGVRMLFGLSFKNRVVRMTALGLWGIGLILVLVQGTQLATSFRRTSSVQQVIPLMQSGSILYITTSDSTDAEEVINFDTSHGHLKLRKNEQGVYLQSTELDVRKSMDGKLEMIKVQSACGKDKSEAVANAKMFNYSFTQTDSVLSLNKEFTLPAQKRFRNQHVKLVLKLPVGKTIYLDESLDGIIYDIDNISNSYDGDMLGHKWMMTEGGLKCLDCDQWETKPRDYYRHQKHIRYKHADDNEDDEDKSDKEI